MQVIDWGRGALVTVNVASTGAAEVAGWTVTLTLSHDAEIRGRDQWRSQVVQNGRQVSVTADSATGHARRGLGRAVRVHRQQGWRQR